MDSVAMDRVDISSDVGERPGAAGLAEDRRILSVVTSANVACGGHAGDSTSMRTICAWAAENGVSVGAQVSYVDREGFGRRAQKVAPAVLADQIAEQWASLADAAAREGTVVRYLRPHGALYNAALVDPEVAAAVIAGAPGPVPVLALAGSELHRIAREAGHRVVAELFADRAIDDAGLLVPRTLPGAVISDPVEVATRLLDWVHTGCLRSITGTAVRFRAESICVHSDTPGAVAAASTVRAALEEAGLSVEAFSGQADEAPTKSNAEWQEGQP